MELQRLTEKEKMRLYHLFQMYLYETLRFYEDDLDKEGNYSYPHFEDSFLTLPAGLICSGRKA